MSIGQFDVAIRAGAVGTILLLPGFGFRRVGLPIAQAPGSLKAALLYCAFFVVIALAFPGDRFALDRAFAGRKRFLGVDWDWGAVLSCSLFGMAHAFGFPHGGFSFDPATMAMTAIPSSIAIWLRLRTGSLLLPVLLHNFGNSFSLLA